jgi:CRP-like cAMP-binding protein
MRLSAFLAKCPGFSGFDSPALERLAANAKTRSFARHEHLWSPGDAPRDMVIVQRGLVKVTRWTDGGSGAIALYGPAEDVESLTTLRGVEHSSSAVALSDEVVVVAVPQPLFLELCAERANSQWPPAWALDRTLSVLGEWIDLLSAGSVEARLAHLLDRLNRRFGDDFDDGTSRIQLSLSRSELAELASTSFEAAIRVLSRWQREGLVIADGAGLTLRDPARLFSLCNRDAQTSRRARHALAPLRVSTSQRARS